jgi:hypothetical protein
MGVAGGPDLIQDGLVLSLDASDRNSYVSGSTTWFDLAGTNNGTLANGVGYTSSFNGSLVFDGVDDYVIVSSSSTLNNWSAQTIGVWFTFSTKNTNYLRLIEKGANNEWTVGINYATFDYKLFLQDLGSTGLAIKSTNALNDNKYHYAVITITPTQYCSMYIDGILNSQSQGSNPSSKTGSINIGRYGDGGYCWNGTIANTQIYNRALTADEVQQNYNAQKSKFGL